MGIPLNKDFRDQVESVQKNVAHPAGIKNLVRRLLLVIDKYDGQEMSEYDTDYGEKVIMTDAAPKKSKAPAQPDPVL